MNLKELRKELNEIVQEYKSHKNAFPFKFCNDAALKLYNEFGLLWVKGGYVGHFDRKFIEKVRDPNLHSREYGFDHEFSYNPKLKLFIDITANQFDKLLPEILIMKVTDQRIALNWNKRNYHTTHYVADVYDIKKHGSNPLEILENGELRLIKKF
tara:strand:+ start:22163 stop:22627 length:465 start_codon:yes stop_codon:yes gene_type:complete